MVSSNFSPHCIKILVITVFYVKAIVRERTTLPHDSPSMTTLQVTMLTHLWETENTDPIHIFRQYGIMTRYKQIHVRAYLEAGVATKASTIDRVREDPFMNDDQPTT